MRLRFHLAAAALTLSACAAAQDGVAPAEQGVAHPELWPEYHYPVPESAATEYGYAMLDRFLRGDRARLADVPARADGAPGTPPPVEDEPLAFVPPPVEHVR